MRTLLAVLRLTWEASPRMLGVTVALSALAAIVPPVTVWLGKRLVDLVVAGAEGGTVSTAELFPTVVAIGSAAALLRTVSTVQANRQVLFSTTVELHAERRLLGRVAAADLGYFDQSAWYDGVARATNDLAWRPYNMAMALVGIAGSAITLAGMLLLLATLSPILAVLSVCSAIPLAYAQRRVGQRIYGFLWQTTSVHRRRQYLRDLLTRPETAKEVRAFGLSEHILERHAQAGDERLVGLRGLYRRGERIVIFTSLLTGLGVAAGYWLVAARGLNGELTPGDLVLLIGAFGAASSQMGVLLASMIELDRGAAFLEDYFSLLTLKPLLPVAPDATPLPAHLEDGLRFENVTFTYPGRSEPSLRDLSLRIGAGRLLALVGENGAGKTTLVKLILRFYDPDEGRVCVGGVDLKQADPVEVRRRVGVLFQDFPQYQFSARDNVAFGRVEKEPTDQAVMEALTASHADHLIAGLADGLDASVGRMFDGSHDLSGGEWQRLALARLLYRDADIWILDEPTSALDAEAEAAIFATLRALLRDRIGIVISHRFSTVRVADQIAVMSNGRITEVGTHDELLVAGGTYARLFELQAAGYR